MGAKKLWADLTLAGYDFTLDQCKGFIKQYWNIFKGVKRFEMQLQNEVHENDGYFLNGYGRPMAVDNDKLRDVVNRFTQGTATDVLMVYTRLLAENLTKGKFDWTPYLWNLHDECLYQVPEEQAEDAAKINVLTMNQLNDILGWTVTLKGDPEIGTSLKDFKIED